MFFHLLLLAHILFPLLFHFCFLLRISFHDCFFSCLFHLLFLPLHTSFLLVYSTSLHSYGLRSSFTLSTHPFFLLAVPVFSCSFQLFAPAPVAPTPLLSVDGEASHIESATLLVNNALFNCFYSRLHSFAKTHPGLPWRYSDLCAINSLQILLGNMQEIFKQRDVNPAPRAPTRQKLTTVLILFRVSARLVGAEGVAADHVEKDWMK